MGIPNRKLSQLNILDLQYLVTYHGPQKFWQSKFSTSLASSELIAQGTLKSNATKHIYQLLNTLTLCGPHTCRAVFILLKCFNRR